MMMMTWIIYIFVNLDTLCTTRGVLQTTKRRRLDWLRRLDERVGSRVRALGYSMDLRRVADECCESSLGHWRSPGPSSTEAAAVAGISRGLPQRAAAERRGGWLARAAAAHRDGVPVARRAPFGAAQHAAGAPRPLLLAPPPHQADRMMLPPSARCRCRRLSICGRRSVHSAPSAPLPY